MLDWRRALELLYASGLETARITGGEPLLSPQVYDVIASARDIGYRDLAITTNGERLAKFAPALRDAGIERCNVSLDSLQKDAFHRMTRGGTLRRVLAGIEAAVAVGFRVRINMVVMKGLNDNEVVDMLTYASEVGAELRYLELMRSGASFESDMWTQHFVPIHDILTAIATVSEVKEEPYLVGETARWYEASSLGRFGAICNTSLPFCEGCDRLRLSSDGTLRGCLSSSRTFDMRPLFSLPVCDANDALSDVLHRAHRTKRTHQFEGQRIPLRDIGG